MTSVNIQYFQWMVDGGTFLNLLFNCDSGVMTGNKGEKRGLTYNKVHQPHSKWYPQEILYYTMSVQLTQHQLILD